MSDKEMDIPDHKCSSMKSADIDISTDDQVTLRECCKERFRPLCQIRRVNNKGGVLVIIWTFLTTTMFFLSVRIASQQTNKWIFNSLFTVIGLILPIAGSLADVRFGRYKIISCGLWMMWLCSVMLTGTLVLVEFHHFEYNNVLILALTVFQGIGWAAYQANIVQFGIDQLTDASVTENKSFIVWLVFAFMAGAMVMYFMLQCIENTLVSSFIVSCNLTLSLILDIWLKRILIKEPTTQNPFKLVYKVICYAIKHKHPRQRSAFTYCEDEIPSRIDFGKIKYGGPFTTEQVEDVKTLLKITLVICIGCIVYSVNADYEHYSTQSKFNSLFHSLSSPLPLGKCLFGLVFDGFFFISGTILISLHEFIINPLCGRLLPTLKSHNKVTIGAFLRLGQQLVSLIIVLYSRQNYLKSSECLKNVTLPCLFMLDESSGFLGEYIDYRWLSLPEFIYGASDVLIYIGTLEFLCAQVPYSMKGLMLGFTYILLQITVATFSQIQKIFESRAIGWGTGVISCEFWYFITKISLQIISTTIFGITVMWYKERKREDVLPNDHMFAERYYSY